VTEISDFLFVMAYFGILQLLLENVEKDGNDEMEDDDLSQRSKLTNDVPYIHARLINYRKITPLKSLRAALFGKLVAVSGTCVRASNTTPLCLTSIPMPHLFRRNDISSN
jgi:DNA replicative helicase MCM subunit Mcm2 (Cdc46/Mcm family)